jgi:hypothetical protein
MSIYVYMYKYVYLQTCVDSKYAIIFDYNRAFAYEKLGLHQASMTDYCESLRLRPGTGIQLYIFVHIHV